MKNRLSYNTHVFFVVVIVSFCLLLSDHLLANDSTLDSNYLPVRTSLIPVYGWGAGYQNNYFGPEYFPMNKINPSAKEHVLYCLNIEEGLNRKHGKGIHVKRGAIWLLGFIGETEDLTIVDNFLQKYLSSEKLLRNQWTGTKKQFAGAVGCYAGMMIKRNIDGAESFFEKYAKVSAWVFSDEKTNTSDLNKAKSCYSDFIMSAYIYSKSDFVLPYIQQKSEDSLPFSHEHYLENLLEMEIDRYSKYTLPTTVPEDKLRFYYTKCFEAWGTQIDALMNKEDLNIPKKIKKSSLNLFDNIALAETVEGGYLKAAARQAAKEYTQVSKKLLDKEAKSLPINKDVLKDIRMAGLKKYDAFHVKIKIEAAIEDLFSSSQQQTTIPAVMIERETSAVTFNIKDSAVIHKKHVPDAVDDAHISPTTGDVKIYMKRLKNKWHWDPQPEEPDYVMTADKKMHLNLELEANSSDDVVADIVQDDYLIATVIEAIDAYNDIVQMLIKGDYDPLTIPLLDNHKLIPLKKRERDMEGMTKALNIEKDILADIALAKLNLDDNCRVEIDCEATLRSFEPSINDVQEVEGIDSASVEVNGYETATVTFMIQSGGQMFKKHASKRAGTRDIDEAGNMQVYMKRINGRWYWNPFGW
ncbi:MAG: hypothetical protein KAS23_16600 [Anaerohalosphaera sp.]|nr:hypothetical protein [Anaerohalosphaera sp.]